MAQTSCNLSLIGKITDLDDGKELEGTFVVIANQNKTQITNEHGRFIFNELCEGNYKIIIQHVEINIFIYQP